MYIVYQADVRTFSVKNEKKMKNFYLFIVSNVSWSVRHFWKFYHINSILLALVKYFFLLILFYV